MKDDGIWYMKGQLSYKYIYYGETSFVYTAIFSELLLFVRELENLGNFKKVK